MLNVNKSNLKSITFLFFLDLSLLSILGMGFSQPLNKLNVSLVQLIIVFLFFNSNYINFKSTSSYRWSYQKKLFPTILFLYLLLRESNNTSHDFLVHFDVLNNLISGNLSSKESDMLGGRYHYPYMYYYFTFILSKIFFFIPIDILINLIAIVEVAIIIPFLLLRFARIERDYLFPLLIMLLYFLLVPIIEILSFGGLPLILGLTLSLYLVNLFQEVSNKKILIFILSVLILYVTHPVSITLYVLIILTLKKFTIRPTLFLFQSASLLALITVFYLNSNFSENIKRNLPQIIKGITMRYKITETFSFENIFARFLNIFSTYNSFISLIFLFSFISIAIYYCNWKILIITTYFVVIIIASNLLGFSQELDFIIISLTLPFMTETLRILAVFNLYVFYILINHRLLAVSRNPSK